MSSCLIKKDARGKVTGVTTLDGQPSELFKEIHSNVLFDSPELSAEVVSSVYTKEISDLFKDAQSNAYATKEPKMFYKSSAGTVYDTFDEVLRSNELGEITFGFKNPSTEEFIPAFSVNTNSSEKSKFLVKAVQQGIVSSRRTIDENGVAKYVGQGENNKTKFAHARASQLEAMYDLGKGNTTISADGTIDFNFQDDYITVVSSGESIRIEDIPNYEVEPELVALHGIANDTRPLKRGDAPIAKQSDKALRQALMNFLRNMGFTYSTLEEYRKNYNTRYGQDADITAIADLTNKVVAISEGANITDELLEEVSHIAIEAYADQASIAGLLVNVEFTPEYAEFSTQYREKYSKYFEGVELEDHVRKEILGKILAKSIKENFNAENKTPEQTDLLSRLKDLWDRFVKFISGKATPYQKDILTDLNNKISEYVLSENMSQFNTNLNSDKFFYDLSDDTSKRLVAFLKDSKESLERVFNQIVQQPVPNSAQLEKIGTDMLQLDILESITAIQGTTKTQLGKIKEAYKVAAKKGESVSQEDHNLLTHINLQVVPLLKKLKAELKATKEFDEELVDKKMELITEMTKTITLNDEIVPLQIKDLESHSNRMIETELEGKTPEQIADIKEAYETVHKDQNFMGQLFGLVSKSQNVWIRKAGLLAAKISSNVAVKTKNVIDTFLRDNAGREGFQKGIVRKVNGQMSSWYWGPIRQDLYEQEKANTKAELAAKLTNTTIEEVKKKVSEGISFRTILGTEDLLKEFQRDYREKLKTLKEQPRSEKYYTERDAKHTAANVSQETKDILRDISSQRAVIYSRPGVRNKQTGAIDRTLLTPTDKDNEANLKHLYEFKKSPYEANGELKAGLKVTANDDLTLEQKKDIFRRVGVTDDKVLTKLAEEFKGYLVEPIDTLEDLPRDSRVVVDMFNLAALNRKDALDKQGGKNSNFESTIDNFEKEGEFEQLLDWALANGTFSVNDAYYKLSDDSTPYYKQAEKFIDTVEDDLLADSLKENILHMKRLQLVKSNLLKQYRDRNNPAEIDSYHMTSTTKQQIRKIENNIQSIKEEFRSLGMEYEYTPANGPKLLKSTNEAYHKDLRELSSEEHEIDFAKSHMTETNSKLFDKFATDIDKQADFRITKMSKRHEDFVDRMEKEGKLDMQTYLKFKASFDLLNSKTRNKSFITKEEKAEYKKYADAVTKELKKLYARDLVSSYYLKYELEGYQELVADIKSGSTKFSDILRDKESVISKHPVLEYMDFNPDYTWTEEVADNDTVNPMFNPEGTFEQPNVEKFIDREFFDRYGINVDEWKKKPVFDITQLEASKNKQEFALLKETIALRKMSLENYGESNKISPYLRPQVTKDLTEGVFTGGLKSIRTNLARFRMEELEYGDNLESGSAKDLGVRSVPKYYLNKVADESMLTENILSAAFLDYQQSVLFTERVKTQRDFQALELQVKNQEFIKSGGAGKVKIKTSEGEASTYYKQMKEIMDYQLYGMRQSRNMTVEMGGKEFDMTKLIHHVQSFFRMSNLALNPIVDAVSMLTGVYNNAMDRYVEDYYAPSSANRANTETVRLAAEFINETGKVSKEGLMNHLVEFFGVQDIETRLKNSAFSRGTKIMAESGYKMSKFANMPVSAKLLITTLMDYRFIDGQFRNSEQFYSYKKNLNKGISETAIKSEFDKYKEDSLYDNLKITKEGVTYSDKYAAKFPDLSKQDIEERFMELVNKMSYRTRSIAQGADGTLNELDQVAAQRDVLWSVAMTHRGWLPILLSRKFTKKHYSEAFDRYEDGHLTSVIGFVRSVRQGMKEGRTYTDVLNNLESHKKKNIKRVFAEIVTLVGMLAAGAMFFGDDDDEDTTAAYNIANYVYTRVVSEVATQTPLGLGGAIVETLENPLTSIRMIKAMEPVELVKDVVTLDYENIGGRLLKNTPVKRIDQLWNMKEKLASYKHFNKGTLFTMSPENVNAYNASPLGQLVSGE